MRANISEVNRPSAFAWLRKHNHGAIIKNNVTVPFRGDQNDLEIQLVDFLKELEVEFDKKMSVHTGTLQAWVKEQLEQDNEVPDSIGWYKQRISKVVK